MKQIWVALCVLLIVVSPAILHADQIGAFNFANDLGKYTSFADVSNGIVAAFVGDNDPGTFEVVPSPFHSLGANTLVGTQNNPFLGIGFAQEIYSLYLDFSLIGPPSDYLVALFYNNGQLVNVVGAQGQIPNGYQFPEGVLFASGPAFNLVVLGSTAQDFAIGNVSADATPVPEPGSIGLLLSSLLGSRMFFRRWFLR